MWGRISLENKLKVFSEFYEGKFITEKKIYENVIHENWLFSNIVEMEHAKCPPTKQIYIYANNVYTFVCKYNTIYDLYYCIIHVMQGKVPSSVLKKLSLMLLFCIYVKRNTPYNDWEQHWFDGRINYTKLFEWIMMGKRCLSGKGDECGKGWKLYTKSSNGTQIFSF